tara:strand:+ start:3551 stop:4945 length:1395 start_codon:yes stop_codon:yes gene_type:complete
MVEKNIKGVNKLINEALIFKQRGDLIRAERLLSKAIKIDPKNFIAFNNIGSIYSARNKPEEAKNFFLKAIHFKPDYGNAIFNLALINEEMGNKQEAIKYYKEAIKIDPKNLSFHHNLSRVDKTYFSTLDSNEIEIILQNEKISKFNKSSGFFILAYDQKIKKNFKKEFYYLTEAHNFFHYSDERINNQASFYWIRLIPKVIEKFNFSSKKYLPKEINPIFITGLPRSGSTLVESIISSGKQIIPNGGETSILNRILLEDNKNFFTGKEFLDKEKKLKINQNSFLKKLINQYQLINLLDKNKKSFFTDKSLENFFFIELIVKLFPDAKIINSERNILQIIISIYQNFLPNIKWSHSIDNILEYIDNYLKIMDRFKKKYPNSIYTVKLEELTTDANKISKDIFRFCNLEWDSKCLEFYKRDDLVSKTASNQQIRNKIFIHDEKKYAAYKEFLSPYATKYEWLKKFL